MSDLPARSLLRYNRSKSIVEGENRQRTDSARLARHSDVMLPSEIMTERGPLRIPTDRLQQQTDAASAESLVEQVQ